MTGLPYSFVRCGSELYDCQNNNFISQIRYTELSITSQTGSQLALHFSENVIACLTHIQVIRGYIQQEDLTAN